MEGSIIKNAINTFRLKKKSNKLPHNKDII